MTFAYIGKPLTRDGFAAYVAGYDFGTIPPDYIVLHHTASPAASWAPAKGAKNWDDGESGSSDEQIQAKRKAQLDGIMRYYQATLGWTAGPHIFVDERWTWLFTPMDTIGVHAREGNSYIDDADRLHYSIGIEVVGDYTHVTWPPAVARNVAYAVAVLKKRLRNFDLVAGPWAGKIGRHADYNKPACPGAAITPDYYLPLFRQAYVALTLRLYRAGPFGAIAFQDRRPDAPASAALLPGETLLVDDVTAGYAHISRDDPRKDVGFVPLGCVEVVS